MFQNVYFNDTRFVRSDGTKASQSDPSGYLISVQIIPNVEFVSYEIYNFIEETVKVDLEDLSLFRSPNGAPTGTVVAQFAEEVTQSRLQKLEKRAFKGSQLQVRLYQSAAAFHKFMRSANESKLSVIGLQSSSSIPIIYVQNFDCAHSSDVSEFFGRSGELSMVKPHTFRGGTYYILFFTSEASAQNAHRTFNGYVRNGKSLIVAPLYKNAAERTFAVHHCSDAEWLRGEIEAYGDIEQIKQSSESDVFVQMSSLESAKAACVLLNRKSHSGTTITTNFVDYDYFQRI